MSSGTGEISFSFACLQTLVKSFRDIGDGHSLEPAKRDALCELVGHLGEVAIPVLIRNLFGGADKGTWASTLLVQLSKSDTTKSRIQTELREYQDAPNLSDSSQLRIADLLATIGGWQDELPAALPPQLMASDELSENYLSDLARCIQSNSDVAHVAAVLLNDMQEQELPEFIETMAVHHPGCAKALALELIIRDDLSGKHRQTLRGITASMSDVLNEVPLSLHRRPTLHLAIHCSGASALIGYVLLQESENENTAIPGQAPYRALRLDIEPRPGLTSAHYVGNLDRSEIEKTMLHPLVEAGFELRPIGLDEAKKRVVLAMRARSRGGRSMPNCYYLGRDILALRNEHLVPKHDSQCDSAALFSRGSDLLERGKFNQARELLEKFSEDNPGDPEAMSLLGSCLLKLQEPESAKYYLERASALAPSIGRYHWNRASLAHQEGRLGECYLAFQQYLSCHDSRDQRQRNMADRFVQAYSRQSLLQNTVRPVHSVQLRKP